MRKIVFLILWMVAVVAQGTAQKTDTIRVHSASMNKEIPNIVILPESYRHNNGQKYPVVYLLHGYGGNYSTWATQTKPNLDRVASRMDLIIVCPDGGSSWYWDSPVNPASRYETYVSRELVDYMDRHYRTIANRYGRAITGFSMGGHGGLWLGFRHPDIYSACGAMSGGVDIRPFPNNWQMSKSLGNYADNPARWDEYTVINQLPYSLAYGPLAIIIDCGIDDFFLQVNQALHEKLLYYHIPHDFTIRPGAHNHQYWNNAIDYQLLFFRKSFDAIRTK